MPQPTLTQRVTSLEASVDDVESCGQIIERGLNAFRVEVRQEFVAVRQEFAAVRTEMTTLEDRLRQEIRDGNEETRRCMRILHEDLVERIAMSANGSRPPKRRRGPHKG